MHNAWDRLHADCQFMPILQADYDMAAGHARNTDGVEEQFWRRAAIRNLFGLIEAWGAWHRYYLIPLWLKEMPPGLFDTDDEVQWFQMMMMGTEKFEFFVADNGRPRHQRKKIRTVAFLKAVVSLTYFLSDRLDAAKIVFKSDGWKALMATILVRDRLMHPKSNNDVEIADSEFDACEAAMSMYKSDLLDLKSISYARFTRCVNSFVENMRPVITESPQTATGSTSMELPPQPPPVTGTLPR